MATNTAGDIAKAAISRIFQETKFLKDRDFIDCLEEIAAACEDAASVKEAELRQAIDGLN